MLKIIQTILHGGVSFITYFVGLHICLTRREKYQISSMLIAIAAVGFNIYIIASLNHYKVFGMIDFAMFIACAMLRFKEKAPFKLLIVFLLNALSMLCELVLDVFFLSAGANVHGHGLQPAKHSVYNYLHNLLSGDAVRFIRCGQDYPLKRTAF